MVPHHLDNNTVGPLLQISEAGLSLFCILGLAATHGVFRRCGPPTPTLVACVASNREDTYLRHRQGGRKRSRTRTELDLDELLVACSRHQH